ncbi:hypothetical protein, partial [Escherichia coli]|uniref:hypothetical protein n=1 Tax=Escherichia coli TaxID=562 RepID=UPI001BAE91BC
LKQHIPEKFFKMVGFQAATAEISVMNKVCSRQPVRKTAVNRTAKKRKITVRNVSHSWYG